MSKAFTMCYMLVALAATILLTDCKSNQVEVKDSQPFSANLVGKWQWVKTVTSAGEITTQTLGRNKSISYGNDGGFGGNYLYLTEDGTTPVVRYQNNAFGQTDLQNSSLTAQFASKYIKFFLIKSSDNTYQDVITTDLVDDYTQGFGSARHYYKRAGAPEGPGK